MLCPCGSLLSYQKCCETIISHQTEPISAEILMRSRYTAYSLGLYQYIYDTYATQSRRTQKLEDIKNWAQETKWLRLEINTPKDMDRDQVIFSAYYLHGKHSYKMTEHSLFIEENGLWRYLTGEITETLELPYPTRNQKCPCLTGKKFKACCGR